MNTFGRHDVIDRENKNIYTHKNHIVMYVNYIQVAAKPLIYYIQYIRQYVIEANTRMCACGISNMREVHQL